MPGTGFLTIGMLQQSTFQRAVITDISPAMLTLCRARVLEHVDSGKNERIAFATYASDDPLFRDGVFDLAIANSVLHHIENYYSFSAGHAQRAETRGLLRLRRT